MLPTATNCVWPEASYNVISYGNQGCLGWKQGHLWSEFGWNSARYRGPTPINREDPVTPGAIAANSRSYPIPAEPAS
jgi:hypothetical protein